VHEGYEGSGWKKDAKEQYFEVNKRQKIALARKAGKKEDEASGLQGGPVVPECRDVDWNRRTSKGGTTGSDAYSAHKGSCRLKRAPTLPAPASGEVGWEMVEKAAIPRDEAASTPAYARYRDLAAYD